jgi:hypothetical protein
MTPVHTRFTDEELGRRGVPPDVMGSWKFPESMAEVLEPIYQRAKTKQPRIEWFVDYIPGVLRRLRLMDISEIEIEKVEFEWEAAQDRLTAMAGLRDVAKNREACALIVCVAEWWAAHADEDEWEEGDESEQDGPEPPTQPESEEAEELDDGD